MSRPVQQRSTAAVSLIQKEYFRLEEVVRDLGLSGSDVIYLAENGQLAAQHPGLRSVDREGLLSRISVTGTGNRFQMTTTGGRGFSISGTGTPMRSSRPGSAEVSSFHAPEGRYCRCSGATPAHCRHARWICSCALQNASALRRLLGRQSRQTRLRTARSAIGFTP